MKVNIKKKKESRKVLFMVKLGSDLDGTKCCWGYGNEQQRIMRWARSCLDIWSAVVYNCQ